MGVIQKNLSNLFGWRTSRKILVIESDDWGSIRMPSLAAFNKLKSKGVQVSKGDALRYNQNDTLAGKNDFEALFDLLSNIKDSKENPVVFTALSLCANPDFEKIAANNFKEYYYEPLAYTLQRYYPGQNILQYWHQGISQGIFVPQFHGREHLNIAAWMKALQAGDEHTLAAFEEGCWGFSNAHPYNVRYQAAFDVTNPTEIELHRQVIKDGLDLFEQTFGYRASFFVPPNGPFNNSLEKTAADAGIKFMSASKIQLEALGNGQTRKQYHYLGQQNKSKQLYITRNCFFEPSQINKNWVKSCLEEIAVAYRWKKPAVISSHRVNYIGALNETNRVNGLDQLSQLLLAVKKQWPQVEFMTSSDLGELMLEDKMRK